MWAGWYGRAGEQFPEPMAVPTSDGILTVRSLETLFGFPLVKEKVMENVEYIVDEVLAAIADEELDDVIGSAMLAETI